LTEFDIVVYLDADMMVMKSGMDELFDFPLPTTGNWLGASHACTCNVDKDPWAPPEWNVTNCPHTPTTHPDALERGVSITPDSPPTYELMNSGTFVFRPNELLWDEIIEFLDTTELLEQFTFPDQNFLDEFFRGRWVAIGWQWNAVKTSRYWHPNIWRDEEVKVLHYIVDKPWNQRVDKQGVAGYLGRDGVTHTWWWDEWEKWALDRKTNGGKEGEYVLQEMKKLVAKPLGCESNDQSASARCVPVELSMKNSQSSPRANYFTCTLGQAALISAESPHNRKTILDIIHQQASLSPDALAVGFAVPATGGDEAWKSLTLSVLPLFININGPSWPR
jgi:lipopolysaccharide biosynthesis glycosyltransferase